MSIDLRQSASMHGEQIHLDGFLSSLFKFPLFMTKKNRKSYNFDKKYLDGVQDNKVRLMKALLHKFDPLSPCLT